jgi:hypothetical protein
MSLPSNHLCHEVFYVPCTCPLDVVFLPGLASPMSKCLILPIDLMDKDNSLDEDEKTGDVSVTFTANNLINCKY